ncbi:MAG TPA: DUF427 domain-containing protein [Intrasporangium sp.]|uniref:DUF427 domain-containing protein n=1 Tax=Intrasporangium sp. TaxID=1925024 RepID=UPI002D78C70D|nr:DUF427 domain-containing protein [Intrasporangium sp.]HET7398918.1 DUF427 domain-containing protein [Intrasporangium sp.]
MAIQMRSLLTGAHRELRVHPVEKWVRADLRGAPVVSSTRAVLVWEPRRVVPSYAVPVADVDGELVPWTGQPGEERPVPLGDLPGALTPGSPFSVHTTQGRPLTIRTGRGDLPGAAFAPDDPHLGGYVVLDWNAFTQWFEEDEPVMGHPHDPFSRIDCLRSSRRVVVAHGEHVLADSARATLLYETPLPVRFYVPREDVRMDLLTPSETHTICAYKGVASYWSAHVDGRMVPDIAWTYEEPLHDAAPVRGLLAFFTERLDLTVDGIRRERPRTPWS